MVRKKDSSPNLLSTLVSIRLQLQILKYTGDNTQKTLVEKLVVLKNVPI